MLPCIEDYNLNDTANIKIEFPNEARFEYSVYEINPNETESVRCNEKYDII